MIKIKLNEEQFINGVKDILLLILCFMAIYLASFNVEISEQNKEIKARYEQVKQDNTELIKQLREADLQPSIVNNLDTRY